MYPLNIFLYSSDQLSDDTLLGNCNQYLASEEMTRAAAIRYPAVKKRFVIARIILRSRLSALLACEPDQIVLKTDANGMPFLGARPDIHFSISHSREKIAVAISTGARIGLDVEYMYRPNRVANIARSCFTEREADEIINSQNQQLDFYKLWTLKEAYVKALGTGLRLSFKSFDFDLSAGIRLIDQSRSSDGAEFLCWVLQGGYVLSLCQLRSEALQPKMYELDGSLDLRLFGSSTQSNAAC